MNIWDGFKQESRKQGVAEDYVLSTALARESLVAFFRDFPNLAIFLGGNVLHLIYGSPRYSRDVDLLPRKELNRTQLAEIAASLQQKLRPFSVLLRKPIDCRLGPRASTSVEVQVAGRRVVSLELSRIAGSVRQTETKLLRSESLASEIVICPVLDELLFLKAKTLFERKFLKARDAFDIWYLLNLGAKLDAKEFDHWLSLEDVESSELRKRLALLTPRRLEDDLAPLLPTGWLEKLRADSYASVIRTVKDIFESFAQP